MPLPGAMPLVVLHKVIVSAERFFVNERTDMVGSISKNHLDSGWHHVGSLGSR
jgi:hypothetical protein